MDTNSWFKIGDHVRIRKQFQSKNRHRVREDTYGKETGVFEITAYYPAMVIDGEESPAAYSVTPVGKQYSTVMLFEHELEEA